MSDKKIYNHGNSNTEILENKLLRYVIVRLIRPFYKNLENKPESGDFGMYKTSKKILNQDYIKENPFYKINEQSKRIILNKEWKNYFNKHFIFLHAFIF